MKNVTEVTCVFVKHTDLEKDAGQSVKPYVNHIIEHCDKEFVERNIFTTDTKGVYGLSKYAFFVIASYIYKMDIDKMLKITKRFQDLEEAPIS